MKVRACRRFTFAGCDLALEVRVSPAMVSPIAATGMSPAAEYVQYMKEDPLPDPEPSPGPYPGSPPPPTSGPIGPGTS